MALTLGLRRGELLALRWVDVDLVDGVIQVEHTLQRINGVLASWAGEDGRVSPPGRRAAVHPAVFRQHRSAQDEERAAAGDRWRETGSVFATKIGTPIEPRNMNRHLDALCRQADVPRIRFTIMPTSALCRHHRWNGCGVR